MRASFSGEKYSCHEMEFNGGSFYTDCPNKTWDLNFFIELSNILMSLRLTDIFIANDCFLNMSDLSIAFVKKQLKYFYVPRVGARMDILQELINTRINNLIFKGFINEL